MNLIYYYNFHKTKVFYENDIKHNSNTALEASCFFLYKWKLHLTLVLEQTFYNITVVFYVILC